MADTLPPRLNPKTIEGPLYRSWTEAGYFHVEPESALSGGPDPYVVVIPPPNVTDILHMGHGLNNTIQDVMVRWRRMQGRVSLWVPGTDHAGIATQNIVERKLAEDGTSRHDLGREAFVERVWGHVNGTGSRILEQLEVIGSSCDWDRTRFTLDEGLSRAVREVFVRLYEKDLIYRGEYIINWCPRCLTALSNEEAEGEEVEGRLYHLRYPFTSTEGYKAEQAAAVAQAAVPESDVEAIGRLPDGTWYLTVSTTRPETMLGDTGVAVNPKDERYAGLVGAEIELPLTGRTIPIIADELVDPGFGTGLVKTAENFGTQGEYPSHPELLDWLATTFIDSGWDVKGIQRAIVTSATYRQESAITPEMLEQDPENRQLARGPRLRLPAQMIRDQALSVAGLLVEKVGGPSVKPYQPEGLWDQASQQYEQSEGDGLYRRSLYTFWKRTLGHPAMLTFDSSTRETCIVRNGRTNTPLQALNLMNDVTYVEAARSLAQRTMIQGGTTPEERVRFVYRLATAHRPRPDTESVLVDGYRHYLDRYQADRSSALELVNVGESPRDETLDIAELASYTMVANLILNLDRTVTKD